MIRWETRPRSRSAIPTPLAETSSANGDRDAPASIAENQKDRAAVAQRLPSFGRSNSSQSSRPTPLFGYLVRGQINIWTASACAVSCQLKFAQNKIAQVPPFHYILQPLFVTIDAYFILRAVPEEGSERGAPSSGPPLPGGVPEAEIGCGEVIGSC